MMSPVTASGAYMAIGSSVGAAVGSAGASVASTTTSVATGASVAGAPQAASKRLMATITNSKERTILDISLFLLFYIYCVMLSAGS